MSTLEQDLQDIPSVPFSTKKPFKMPEADVNRNLPRYLFTVANFVTLEAARDRKHLRAGGVELWNPCLRASDMLVRRGTLTPLLLDTLTPVPTEEVNTDDTQYFYPEGESVDGELGGPTSLNSGALMGYPARPGEQIINILQGPENVDGTGGRGLVEITALMGYEYNPILSRSWEGLFDAELWKIQKAIFPDYPHMPVTLDELRGQIEEATRQGGTIGNIAHEMRPSCDIFGSWGHRAIEEIHQAMNNAAALGYVFPYESIHFALLEQFGMERQDLHYKGVASQKPQQPLDLGALMEMFKASTAASRDESRADVKAFISELFHQLNAPIDRPAETVAPPSAETGTKDKAKK